MVIMRAFLALVAGFAAITVLGLLNHSVLGRYARDWTAQEGRPGPGSAFVQIGSAFLISAAGGYFTAWIARGNPLVHVLALGLVVLALSALSALQAKGKQPVWFQLALLAIAPLGVLAGGLIRLRVLGIL
jgi:hypothetical protein